jgi:hypothetical protein
MEIERKKNLYEWCSCCQEDKRLLYGKGPHAHPLSHFLFFFLPQNTNHKLHGRRQTQGKIQNSKFKIQNSKSKYYNIMFLFKSILIYFQ